MHKEKIKTPEIKLTKIDNNAELIYKEILSSFIEPKLNEKAAYVTFEVMKGHGMESRHNAYIRGKAKIHGLNCFESVSTYINFNDGKEYEIITFDRIHKDHVQSLAYIEAYPNGTREFYSYKDAHFMEHWATGVENCGMKINLKNEDCIVEKEDALITANEIPGTYDVVGKYLLEINDKKFEVARLVYIAAENQISDFFINLQGKEIMHRYFIPDEGFQSSQINNPYSNQFPEAEILKINSRQCICTTYVINERYLL